MATRIRICLSVWVANQSLSQAPAQEHLYFFNTDRAHLWFIHQLCLANLSYSFWKSERMISMFEQGQYAETLCHDGLWLNASKIIDAFRTVPSAQFQFQILGSIRGVWFWNTSQTALNTGIDSPGHYYPEVISLINWLW